MRPPDPALLSDLERALGPGRVLSRPLDRLGRSADASIYRMIPEVVVRPRGAEEVRGLLACARRHRRSLTFRAAGTSLSGQAVTEGILVELAQHWTAARVLDRGDRVWAEPGVIGGFLNKLLAPHRRRLGPDPASLDAAMMGGILANNASGMCCGVSQNSYHTLESLHLLLADGSELKTGEPDADVRLRQTRPDLHEALHDLRDEIRADPALVARVRHRFRLKNTMGYSLQAFLDHDSPAEILARLMVGSQGTLGFLASMTLRTVPEPPARATALLLFEDLASAGAAVPPLAALGAAALEILDSASLVSQAGERRYPFEIGPRTAALLAEFREEDAPRLEARVAGAEAMLSGLRLPAPVRFTRDPAEREDHWRLRKGLFPSVGGLRAAGTSVVIEDVAVPVEALAEAIRDLHGLFARHGFEDAIVFGHAKDGNLHFVFARDFSIPDVIARYASFMQGLTGLVLGKYDGSLKAEHGSGRNMAPFVEAEWGSAAYGVMRRVKRLLDPEGLLNPGVLLSDDPGTHLKHLKALPSLSPLADKCIECGFCEARCPSRDLTLTPRQRIVVSRELSRLARQNDPQAGQLEASLRADFEYQGITTCAGDSMCQTSCPVKIDTGALIKEMRSVRHSRWARRLADLAASQLALVARLARLALRSVALLRRLPAGPQLVRAASGIAHRLTPSLIPRLASDLPLPGPAGRLPEPRVIEGAPRVVYFPSCLSRVLGSLPGERAMPTAQAMLDVLAAAGFAAAYPEGLASLCCGMPFLSRGFPEAARAVAARTAEALWAASHQGRDLVVTDASPCAGTLLEQVAAQLRQSGRVLRTADFVSFWAREALPRLGGIKRRPGTVIVHPTCTLLKAGGLDDLLTVARAHSEKVTIPAAAECCGFAGDGGFLVPELTASATAREAAEVKQAGDGGFYSTCRTCELGLSRAAGRECLSLLHLVRESLLDG